MCDNCTVVGVDADKDSRIDDWSVVENECKLIAVVQYIVD